MERFISNSYEETVELASEFAKRLKKGSVVAFLGGLGMGKTAFTTGLAKGLGIDADVSSPTFALVNEYRSDNAVLCHFDMYRVSSWDDLYSTGYFDYLDSGAYLAIEWSENIYNALENDAVIVEITKLSENSREFKIYTKEESNDNSRN